MLAPDAALLRSWLRRYLQEHDVSPRTAESYFSAVVRFERWLGFTASLHDLADRFNAYLESLAAGNRFTAKAQRGSLLCLLRSGADAGLCELPKKIRSVRCPQLHPRAFTTEELAMLRRHATPRERAAIALAFDTGLRRSDLFDATWQQVFGERLIRNARKTGRRIVRRLRPTTLGALKSIRRRDEPHLLGRLTPTIWRRAWHALGKRAGVDVNRRGLQAIRRTGATLSKRAGFSASEYLGHSPRSAGLAEQFYIDPLLLDDAPPLPPAIE
jgi:integrase